MEFTFVLVALWIGVGTCNGIRSARQYEWHNSFQVPGPYIPPRSEMDVSLIIDNRSKPKHYALLADAVQQYNLNEADPSVKGLTIDIADSKMTASRGGQEHLVTSASEYDVAQYDGGQLKQPRLSFSPALLVLLPIIMMIGLVATLSFMSLTGKSASSIFSKSSQQQQQEANNNNANNANNDNNLMLLASLSEFFASTNNNNYNYPFIIINATGRNFFDGYQ